MKKHEYNGNVFYWKMDNKGAPVFLEPELFYPVEFPTPEMQAAYEDWLYWRTHRVEETWLSHLLIGAEQHHNEGKLAMAGDYVWYAWACLERGEELTVVEAKKNLNLTRLQQ